MAGIRYYLNHASRKLEVKKCEDVLHASKAHFHHQISIGFIEKGSCMLEVHDKTYSIEENTLVIIPANRVHKCNPKDHRHWGFKMLYIDAAWFEKAFNQDSSSLIFLYRQVDKSFYELFECLFNPSWIASEDMGYESVLVESILKVLETESQNAFKIAVESQDRAAMLQIKTYLDGHYLQAVVLEDLCSLVHLSKYYIIRQFQQIYGVSPYQYLVNLRINRAKKLLGEGKEIIEAALNTGFYDQSHFTKCFKQYVGLTPMQYRKHIK